MVILPVLLTMPDIPDATQRTRYLSFSTARNSVFVKICAEAGVLPYQVSYDRCAKKSAPFDANAVLISGKRPS
ncbi:MAG: hypothetical protein BWY84_00645 [Candidatus Aerophobetes bacterium ADurb.Bin490]|nr:MAG: hypothetical protein BWY84_00645 [Candidatus Aerophobetes bacterium ADurb.Bin490]